jgi:3-oxoacyl-[acyl-carrier-protein] synthase-3
MALHTALSTGRLNRGDRILLLGTGAGLSVGGTILRW